MFESRERLLDDVAGLLGACCGAAGGRYACVLGPKGVLYEHGSDESGQWVFRQFFDKRADAIFGLPRAMAAGGEVFDAFAEWETPADRPADEFLLAFINGKVAVVVVCPEAEKAQTLIDRPLRALVDRLFRLEPAWRIDETGRGLFLSQPRLDLVVVGRPAD
jgi:hypothetical protein